MKRRTRIIAIAVITCVMLSACGDNKIPTDVAVDTLILDKSGTVTYFLTDSFEEDYYEIDELEAMAKEEAGGDKKTEVTNVAMSGMDPSRVVITYSFEDLKTYNSYTSGSTAFGTVKELVLEGYSCKTRLVSVKDGSGYEQSDIMAAADRHMLISEEHQVFYMPYKAEYVSAGVEVASDGSIDATNAEGTVFVLFRK